MIIFFLNINAFFKLPVFHKISLLILEIPREGVEAERPLQKGTMIVHLYSESLDLQALTFNCFIFYYSSGLT